MHAAAITAYKDFASLLNLTKQLKSYNFVIAIHIDKKAKYTESQVKSLTELGASVISKYDISWGHYNHLLAIIDLVDQIVTDERVTYIHTLSGQDISIVDKKTLEDFCDGRIFMSMTDEDEMPKRVTERYELRDWFWRINGRKLHKTMRAAGRATQRITGLRRKKIGPYKKIYKGMVWLSAPANALKNIILISRNNGFLRDLRSVNLPEEFFFQTAIMHSAYACEIEGNNLRYTDWTTRNGSHPAILDGSDIKEIEKSQCLFARKIDSQVSSDIINHFVKKGILTST